MSCKVVKIILPLIIGAIIITMMILEINNVFDTFDKNITRFIVDHRGSKYGFIYWVSRILTELGNYFVFIALFIGFGFYFKWDYRLWYLLIIGIIGISLNYGIKLIVDRERPLEAYRWMKETSASFPSSHSAISTVVYLNLFLVSKRTIKNDILRRIIMISCIVIMIIVPITRIVLAVHYFTDILGGVVVGLFVTILGEILYLHNKTVTNEESNL